MGLAMNLRIYVLLSCLLVSCCSNDEHMEEDVYRVDSFTVHDRLVPYDWHYIKVELQPFVTFASLEVEPDADFGKIKIKIGHSSNLPVLCLRKGGLPLPDISNVALEGPKLDNFSHDSTKTQNLWSAGQCYFIRERVTIELTSEQISLDAFFVGLFNGIGPIRTQAKMINRGPIYDLSTTLYIKGCKNQSMRGQLCNQRVEELSCHQSPLCKFGRSDETNKYNGIGTRWLICNKFLKQFCHQDLASKTYFLDVLQPAEELMISVSDLRSFTAQQTEKIGITLMCYARYGAIPENMSYDYAVDLTRMPLMISRPKIGTWYFKIQPVDKSNVQGTRLQNSTELCHSVEWDVLECHDGKAGPNCASPRYLLQVPQRDSSDAFLVYLPKHVNIPVELHNLPLEPLLSNTSAGIGRDSDFAWTYFDFDVQQGASGKNIHIELTSNTNITYQLYIRFGGLPSTSDWDYFYINQRSNSENGSSMFKLYEISERRVNAYLLYPKEGLWSFGLRHPVLSNPHWRTELSLSFENCPNHCSYHGKCTFHREQEPNVFGYYFCECDGRYGGFDCGTQLVSPSAQRWHVLFLIASNAAALLPAVLALHRKAYAEWVVFICSGVASGLYHACDIGSWCTLRFSVLQFMDFWLSFMAVLSTFVYLAFITEDARRTIHTISSIVTVLIAVNGPTKSRNIPLVLAFGAFALVCAWLVELFSTYRSNSLSSLRSSWNIQQIWLKVKLCFPNLLKTLKNRFRWRFVFAGCVAVAIAALSWNLESVESYWIWHSMWHVSIYTSAFLFLCSRSTILRVGIQATEDDDTQVHLPGNKPATE